MSLLRLPEDTDDNVVDLKIEQKIICHPPRRYLWGYKFDAHKALVHLQRERCVSSDPDLPFLKLPEMEKNTCLKKETVGNIDCR